MGILGLIIGVIIIVQLGWLRSRLDRLIQLTETKQKSSK